MKSKLTIFFAGVGAGLLVAFLAIGFAAKDFAPARVVTTPVLQSGTNLLEPIYWKRAVVTYQGRPPQ